MENASKALLMAAGVLVGVLILTLIATLFISLTEFTNEYQKTKMSEEILNFNTNFTKYLGQDLTVHEVVTITNFAKKENNKVIDVIVKNGKTKGDIEANIEVVYKIKSIKYDDENVYVKEIEFDIKR